MYIKKKIPQIYFLFLISHLVIWTFVPYFTNTNLPLDTIEALAWGSNLDWGFNKHPPFSALVVQIFYSIFGANDFFYYLLSQIFIVIGFIYLWKLCNEFFQNNFYSLLSVLILETIVFFNYTTPEFNVYVCQIPLKSLTVYFFWKSVNLNKIKDWSLVGMLSAFGMLTHYSFIFLILSLFIFFIFFLNKNKKIFKNFIFSFAIFVIILSPHLVWLIENNFITIKYAFTRSGIEEKYLIDHFLKPSVFLLKQIGMLSIFFITFFLIFYPNKKKINFKKINQKKLFIFSISLMPILIVLIVSILFGARIRTMWMSTFYLYFGLMIFYFFQEKISFINYKRFIYIFSFLFFLSPITYMYISLTNEFKRTDYPGKEISRLVQNKWDKNFLNEIKIVIGDEWFAGNLSYHLKSRPKWLSELKNELLEINENQGIIYTGNPKILKSICPGVFGTIKPVGYCMIGIR